MDSIIEVLNLEKFGKAFIPKKFRASLRIYLLKAGLDSVPYEFFGGLFYVTLVLTYFVYFGLGYPILSKHSLAVLVLGTFITWGVIQLLLSGIVIAIVAFYLNIKIYNRTKDMERLLPDYLQLVSTNLKGGMSFDKSLWVAIRPEFEVLAREITIVSKKVMTGNDLVDALEEFAEKYDSPILHRSLNLIMGEIESGGRIAEVIDHVIDNLRKIKTLKDEMAANTITYMIFIGAIVIVIAPALFALSFQLLQIIIGFAQKFAASAGSSTKAIISVDFSKVSIDPVQFKYFSACMLSLISICSSMIISIIEKGDIKGGLKYIPLFTLGSLFFYFLFSYVLGSLFAGLVV